MITLETTYFTPDVLPDLDRYPGAAVYDYVDELEWDTEVRSKGNGKRAFIAEVFTAPKGHSHVPFNEDVQISVNATDAREARALMLEIFAAEYPELQENFFLFTVDYAEYERKLKLRGVA